MVIHGVTESDLNPQIVNAILRSNGPEAWQGYLENYYDRANENKNGVAINYSSSPQFVKTLIQTYGFKPKAGSILPKLNLAGFDPFVLILLFGVAITMLSKKTKKRR